MYTHTLCTNTRSYAYVLQAFTHTHTHIHSLTHSLTHTRSLTPIHTELIAENAFDLSRTGMTKAMVERSVSNGWLFLQLGKGGGASTHRLSKWLVKSQVATAASCVVYMSLHTKCSTKNMIFILSRSLSRPLSTS